MVHPKKTALASLTRPTAIDCSVKASVSEGWNNAGSQLSYVTQRDFASTSVKEEFYSRYSRGISVEFKAQGYIETWDTYFAFSVLVDLIVFIAAVLPLIMELVATYCLHSMTAEHGMDKESMTLYYNVIYQQVNKKKIKSRISAQVLAAVSE